MLQSELNTAPAASIERPAGLTLSDELIQDIRNMPPLSRPAPKTYIAPEAIAEHLGHFDEGAARFMTDTNLQKYGIGQRDGTAFVIPAAEANALEAAAAGSATKLEKALGLPDGLLQNNNLVRVDIPRPRELVLRMPSGNEAGANSQWIPGGRLPDGGREAVISVGRLQAGQYSTRVVSGGVGNVAAFEGTAIPRFAKAPPITEGTALGRFDPDFANLGLKGKIDASLKHIEKTFGVRYVDAIRGKLDAVSLQGFKSAEDFGVFLAKPKGSTIMLNTNIDNPGPFAKTILHEVRHFRQYEKLGLSVSQWNKLSTDFVERYGTATNVWQGKLLGLTD